MTLSNIQHITEKFAISNTVVQNSQLRYCCLMRDTEIFFLKNLIKKLPALTEAFGFYNLKTTDAKCVRCLCSFYSLIRAVYQSPACALHLPARGC